MRRLLLLVCLLLVGCGDEVAATVQPTPAPTQTPVVVFVVVTATPEAKGVARPALAATDVPDTATGTVAPTSSPSATSSATVTAGAGTATRRPTRTVTNTPAPSPTETPYASPTPCLVGADAGKWFTSVFSISQQLKEPAYYLSKASNGSVVNYQKQQALVSDLVARGRALAVPPGQGYDYAEDDWHGALDNYELLAKADMGDPGKGGYFAAAEKAYAKARDEFDATYQLVCPHR